MTIQERTGGRRISTRMPGLRRDPRDVPSIEDTLRDVSRELKELIAADRANRRPASYETQPERKKQYEQQRYHPQERNTGE
jgi:hypothetical protein